VDAAAEEYSLAAYYSNFEFETILETGNFFIENGKLEEYKRLISVNVNNPRVPFESKVAFAFIMAKAASKDGNRHIEVIGEVMDNAPVFVDAFYLYADWLLLNRNSKDTKAAVYTMGELSKRLKDDNDLVILKLAQVAFNDNESFETIGKAACVKLSDRYSNAGYGSVKARKAVIKFLDTLAQSPREDAEFFKGLLKKVQGATTNDVPNSKVK